jgi:hypothetical protein
MAPAESESENSSLILIKMYGQGTLNLNYKCMNKGLCTVEDSTISLFPNFPMRSAMEREASREIFCREEMMTYYSSGVAEGGQFAGWRSGNPIH